jgi:hypothetical protein
MTDTQYIAMATAELKKQIERELLINDPEKNKAVAILCGERPLKTSQKAEQGAEHPHAK